MMARRYKRDRLGRFAKGSAGGPGRGRKGSNPKSSGYKMRGAYTESQYIRDTGDRLSKKKLSPAQRKVNRRQGAKTVAKAALLGVVVAAIASPGSFTKRR